MSNEPTKIDEKGNKFWLNSRGQTHRDNDLPAIIRPDGYHVWYQNNQWHRDNDLPAKIWPNGMCEWWINGRFIKEKQCTKEEIEGYKKSYYLKKALKANRFENLIK